MYMPDSSRDIKGEVDTLGWELKKMHFMSKQLLISEIDKKYDELKMDSRNTVDLFDKVQHIFRLDCSRCQGPIAFNCWKTNKNKYVDFRV